MRRVFMIGYSSHKGGVETYIDNLVSNINKDKVDIILSQPEINIDGKIWHRPLNRHNYLKWWRFWSRFFKVNKFDAIYFNTCDIVSIDLIRFAKAAKIPVRIIHSHSTGILRGLESHLSFFHKISEKINRKIINKYATHLLACSHAAGEYLYGTDKHFEVIRNGIDIPKYSYCERKREMIRESNNIGDNEYLIGCIGRLTPEKNILFSLDVFSTICKKTQKFRLVYLGDGEKYCELKAEVESRGLSGSVIVKGSVDNIHEWVSALDCVLMPSIFEGLPFSLIEAQAAGLPCVVSTGVPKESDLTGLLNFLELSESKDAWADAVVNACKSSRVDTLLTLSKIGYSMGNTAERIEEILISSN